MSSDDDKITDLHQHGYLRLRTVLNSLPIAVTWASLLDARILFTNRKFTEFFGWTMGDFETVPEWVNANYPNAEHRARAEQGWYKYFGNPTTSEFEIEPVELDVRCKDGHVKTTIHGGIILPEAGWALATFVDISDRKRDELLIRHLAEVDALTALPNRRSFDAYLARSVADAIRENRSMHLLVLDLDRFKEVNDTHGHQTGDYLLREVATRLKACVRSSDVVARFGGDEFGIILPNSSTEANVTRICEKITDAISAPFRISGNIVSIGTSIGVASIPRDATDAHVLFAAADRSLYISKRRDAATGNTGIVPTNKAG